MQRTALLTGYSGFLGRHTFEALVASGWKVYLAGRTPPTDNRHAGFVHIDLDRPETIAALRNSKPTQEIVHLACRVGWNGGSEAELLAPNVLATGLLADISKAWGSHLVFASAALVHGVAEQVISSQSDVAPDTPYAKSKWLGEQLITASGTAHGILRMGGLFGRTGPAHLGLNKAIESALRNEPPTRVGRGVARRNYLFVKDASDSILAAMERGIQGTHLLAGPEVLSVSAMLDHICNILCPSLRPLEAEGSEARDQIIERSPNFGPGITFAAALQDIAREAKACASD